MELGEDETLAAVRETFEETGFIETDYIIFTDEKIYFEVSFISYFVFEIFF
jgi:8-oxo-dGTP pyrophosphatase MutT (NUDIX family)